MAYVITDECINCGACESECPSGAISDEGEKRIIDIESCTECGNCVASCPVNAIIEQ